jgi:hypothetical protein
MPNEQRLDLTHPDYEIQAPLYQLWDDLFQGGKQMESKDKAKQYLPRHPYEITKQYEIRLSRATYRNLAAPIVEVFSSALSDPPPDREQLPERIADYVSDVDRAGSSANQFMGDVHIKAAARGLHFVLVDSPRGDAQTRAEAQAQGIRPYFVQVPAWSVLDWSIGEDRMLDWVKIREGVEVSADPFAGHEHQEQYKIWYRDTWEVWVEDEDENGKRTIRIIDEGVNPLGVIPLVPFHFQRKSQMVGTSALDDVASLLKRVYMRDSELDKALLDGAVEVPQFIGFTEEELSEFVVSTNNGLRAENAEARMEYAAPTGRVYDALRQAINEDESRIREIALRMVRPESRQVESADSKREDRKQLDSQLARFAANMEHSERLCWKYMAMWLGEREPEIEVTYNKDFSAEEVGQDLMRAFIDLRRIPDLSRETFWKMLNRWGYLPEDFDPVEEQQRLEAENRTAGRLGGNLLTTRQSVQTGPGGGGIG